jgi:hypothetical protein
MTIARLFEAAFGKPRTEASIHKALGRKIPKGPEYTPGQKDYVFYQQKSFSPNPQFLEEEARRRGLGYPQR